MSTVNVTSRGAKGDGKTDDTDAFNKALRTAQGKKLTVPAGHYMIDATKSLRPFSNTVKRCASQESPAHVDGAQVYGASVDGTQLTLSEGRQGGCRMPEDPRFSEPGLRGTTPCQPDFLRGDPAL